MISALLLTALLLPQEHVSATASLSAEEAAVGATVDVLVDLEIDAGWHVYHPDQDPSYGIPVSVSVQGEGVTAGALQSLQPGEPHTVAVGSQTLEYLWLSDAPRLKLPLTVGAGTAERTLTVTVGWQVCDDSVCLPPTSQDYTLTLAVQQPAGLEEQQPAELEWQKAVGENVDVYATLDRATEPSGGTLNAQLRLELADGWHAYHPDQNPDLGIPVSVTVSGDGFTAGKLRPLQPGEEHVEMIGGEVYEYLWLAHEGELELPVTVSGDEGARELTVTVVWQVCDDSICLPPAERSFTFPVEVAGKVAPGAAAAAGSTQSTGGVPPHPDELPLAELPEMVTPKLIGVEVEGGKIVKGAEMNLVFELQVQEGWHVYHPDQKPEFGAPVSVELLGEGLRAIGGVIAEDEPTPHSEMIGDQEWEYLWLEGKPRFRQRVRVTGEPEEIRSRAVIRWMACDDSSCDMERAYGFALDNTSLNSFILAAGEIAGVLGQGFWAFIFAAAAAGLFTLATPCVFPMIPITISFFTKRAEQGKGSALGNALSYGGGIVLTFVGLGLGAAALLGASGANDIASNPWLNIALAGLFLFFAFSLLGFYEINAPRWMQTMASRTQASGQQKSGYWPVVLMAVAFSVTAFTCTVGFVGGLLALAAGTGSWVYAVLGMTVYALVFATPFVVLALFPTLMKGLPQAGGWMNAVKVSLGFIEMIAAWKFLSNADRSWDLQLLTRPVVIALTALPLALTALYLFGLYRTKHDFEKPKPGKVRIAIGVLFAALTLYVADGFRRDAYAGGLEGFFPPLAYGVNEYDDEGRHIGPAKLGWYDNYPEAFDAALEKDRVLFLDFTGVTCVNCLRMEGNIFPVPEVRDRLAQVERAHLWVDKAPHGDFNKALQFEEYNSQQQPQYVLIDPRDNEILGIVNGYRPDPQVFADFLQKGLDDYAKRTPSEVARPRFRLQAPAAAPDPKEAPDPNVDGERQAKLPDAKEDK